MVSIILELFLFRPPLPKMFPGPGWGYRKPQKTIEKHNFLIEKQGKPMKNIKKQRKTKDNQGKLRKTNQPLFFEQQKNHEQLGKFEIIFSYFA